MSDEITQEELDEMDPAAAAAYMEHHAANKRVDDAVAGLADWLRGESTEDAIQLIRETVHAFGHYQEHMRRERVRQLRFRAAQALESFAQALVDYARKEQRATVATDAASKPSARFSAAIARDRLIGFQSARDAYRMAR